MRCLVLTIGVLCLACAFGRTEEDPRAVIEKAIKARGGPDQDKVPVASFYKYRGQYKHSTGGNEMLYAATTDIFRQVDGKGRTNYLLKRDDADFEMITLTHGKQLWRKAYSGEWAKLADADAEAYLHRDRVVALSALLKDPGFTLRGIEGVMIDNRATVGVNVAFKGQPDVPLYFDQQTGLLARYILRIKQPGEDREQEWVITRSDYREVDFAALAEEVLKNAGLPVEQAAILDYLKRKVPSVEKLKRAEMLVRQLGDDDFDKRERAVAELVKLGPVVAPLLRNAARDDDVEVVRRAETCLKEIEGQFNPQCLEAAIQLLALRQPPGSTEVLLAILPSTDEPVDRVILSALHHIGQRAGEPDQALVKALQDSNPQRRRAAEAALGKDGGAYVKQPGRRVFIRGSKQPRKLTYQLGDSVNSVIEVVDIQFFNRLDDGLFTPPETAK